MPSTLSLKETDPHDIFVIEPDVVLAARANQPSAKPKDVPPAASQDHAYSEVFAGLQAPSLDAPFRATAVENNAAGRSAIRKWAGRAAIAFLFAFCSAVAAAGWKHYGDTAKAMALSYAPKFILAASPPQETAASTEPSAEQPGAPALQAAVTDQAAAQPGVAAQSADTATPAAAALPADTAQLLQSMTQQIEQLKASVDQLKAGQDQMARDIARNAESKTAMARTPEPSVRPKLPAPPPRAAALPVHKPKPVYPAYPPVQASAAPLPRTAAPLPQTYAAPAALPPPPPAQAAAESDDGPVVRPPMPLR
jgi:hypothetical protein